MPKKKTTEPKKITWAGKEGTAWINRRSRHTMLDELEAHLDKLPHVPFWETKYGESPREIAQRLINEERARIEAECQREDDEIQEARVEHFSKDNRRDTEAWNETLRFFQEANQMRPKRRKDLAGYIKSDHVKEALIILTDAIFTVHYGLRWNREVQKDFEQDADSLAIPELRVKYGLKKVEALCNLCDPLQYVEILYQRNETPTTVATKFFRDFLAAAGLARGRGAPKKHPAG